MVGDVVMSEVSCALDFGEGDGVWRTPLLPALLEVVGVSLVFTGDNALVVLETLEGPEFSINCLPLANISMLSLPKTVGLSLDCLRSSRCDPMLWLLDRARYWDISRRTVTSWSQIHSICDTDLYKAK